MKPVKINMIATINRGVFKGIVGKVIAYDYENDEVILVVDSYSNIITDSESIDQ